MQYPIKEFTLEVVNKCNFRCEFCPYDDMKRAHGRMDFKLACRLIDEVTEKNLARSVGMEIMGEPMMYPFLFDLLDHARSRGLPVWLTTNGSLFNEKNISKLLDGALETIQISYQTPNEKTFAMRGATMNFADYRSGIQELVRYRLHNESPTEVIILVMCTMHNILRNPRILDRFCDVEEEVWKWSGFVKTEGGKVDGDAIRTALMEYRKNAFRSTIETRILITPGVSVRICLSQRWGPWMMDKHKVRVAPSCTGFCANPLEQVHVLWDGRVTYCCFDFDGELVVANINEMTIEEVLKGPIAEIRAAIRRNELPSDFCRRCKGYINTLDLLKAVDYGAAMRLTAAPDMLKLFYGRLTRSGIMRKLNPLKLKKQ